jgi:hypothetical protein
MPVLEVAETIPIWPEGGSATSNDQNIFSFSFFTLAFGGGQTTLNQMGVAEPSFF